MGDPRNWFRRLFPDGLRRRGSQDNRPLVEEDIQLDQIGEDNVNEEPNPGPNDIETNSPAASPNRRERLGNQISNGWNTIRNGVFDWISAKLNLFGRCQCRTPALILGFLFICALFFVFMIGFRTIESPSMKSEDYVDDFFKKRPPITESEYRLSGDQIPLNYILHMIAEVKGWNGATESRLTGKLKIELRNLREGATIIELNALNLDIKYMKLHNRNNVPLDFSFTPHPTTTERISVTTASPMGKNAIYFLEISYEAKPTFRAEGVYESWYHSVEKPNEETIALLTNNKYMETRRWIPCFDEPSFKAPLTLTLEHSSDLHARANSGTRDVRTEDGGWTITWFLQTPPLPPHMYAFSLNDYRYDEDIIDNIFVRIGIARYHQVKVEKILAKVTRAIRQMKRFFHQPFFAPFSDDEYPLVTQKLDVLFVPAILEDVPNFGVLSVDDGALIKEVSFDLFLFKALGVHNFNNTMTPAWWSDDWIDIGLRTKQGFDHGEYSFITSYPFIMRLDVYESSPPLFRQDVYTREDAEFLIFSSVKAPLLFHMFESYLTKPIFDQAISKLDQKPTVDTDTLCYWLSTMSANIYIKEICEDFARLPNYPIVRVHRNETHAILYQERFIRGHANSSSRDTSTKWTIPIFYHLNGHDRVSIFNKKDDFIEIEVHNMNFSVNADFKGCYRVIYDDYSPYLDHQPHTKMLIDAGDALIAGYGNTTELFSYLMSFTKYTFEQNDNSSIDAYTRQRMTLEASIHFGIRLLETDLPWWIIAVIDKLVKHEQKKKEYESPKDGNSHCKTNETLEDRINLYRNGTAFQPNFTERVYITKCLRTYNEGVYTDLLWDAYNTSSKRIRNEDFAVPLYPILEWSENMDVVLTAILKRANESGMSLDQQAEVLEKFFYSTDDPITPAMKKMLVDEHSKLLEKNWMIMTRIFERQRALHIDSEVMTPILIDLVSDFFMKERGYDINDPDYGPHRLTKIPRLIQPLRDYQ